MIGLKKKQPFSLKNKLMMDFALPLNGDMQNEDVGKRLQALKGLGVQQVVFVTEPKFVVEADDRSNVPFSTNILTAADGLIVETVPSYWLDEAFEIFVKQHLLTAYRDKYVLLALQNFDSIRRLKSPVFEIRARGYEPVILHRYPKQYVQIKTTALEYLSDLGCLFQLDLLTLAGIYGARARSKAENLISKGWASALTTGVRTADDVRSLQELMLHTSAIKALQHIIDQRL